MCFFIPHFRSNCEASVKHRQLRPRECVTVLKWPKSISKCQYVQPRCFHSVVWAGRYCTKDPYPVYLSPYHIRLMHIIVEWAAGRLGMKNRTDVYTYLYLSRYILWMTKQRTSNSRSHYSGRSRHGSTTGNRICGLRRDSYGNIRRCSHV